MDKGWEKVADISKGYNAVSKIRGKSCMPGKNQFCEANSAMDILELFTICEAVAAPHSLQGGANAVEFVWLLYKNEVVLHSREMLPTEFRGSHLL